MLSRLDFHSTQAGARYVDFLNTLRMFVISAMRRDPTDAGVRTVLKRTAIDRARNFKEDELDIFDFALEDTVREARETLAQDVQATGGLLDLPDTVSAYMDELSAFYDTEITSQLQRDISQASNRLHEFALEVFMQRTQPFVSDQDAHVKALIDTSEQTRFFFRDRSGRRHASQKFVRSMFRQTLLLAGLHAYAVEAALAGALHMVVTHPENKAGVTGTQIGFRRDQGMPLITDLKDEIFHPNSRAFVKAVF
jgi:hypothetical protein